MVAACFQTGTAQSKYHGVDVVFNMIWLIDVVEQHWNAWMRINGSRIVSNTKQAVRPWLMSCMKVSGLVDSLTH